MPVSPHAFEMIVHRLRTNIFTHNRLGRLGSGREGAGWLDG
jgi:hypothetical protein